MNFAELKFRIIAWLAPAMVDEIFNLRWEIEANKDLHICPIPYSPDTLQIAFENCRNMEPDMIAGKATIQDRQTSLMEIYRRICKCQE